jgi:hypothetical protein
VCASCGLAKPRSEFATRGRTRHGDARYAYCRVCQSARQRTTKLTRFYNITPEEYDVILAHQGGVCAICLRPPRTMRLSVDHHHGTGLIRGLICYSCNKAVGIFNDDEERVRRAAHYLASPPATEALGAPRHGLKGRVCNKAATRRKLNDGASFIGEPKRPGRKPRRAEKVKTAA